MPNDDPKFWAEPDSYQVAEELAARLEAVGCEYALGGAIALGFWAEARGTLDVDVTLYLPLDDSAGCVQLLEKIGCEFDHRPRSRYASGAQLLPSQVARHSIGCVPADVCRSTKRRSPAGEKCQSATAAHTFGTRRHFAFSR